MHFFLWSPVILAGTHTLSAQAAALPTTTACAPKIGLVNLTSCPVSKVLPSTAQFDCGAPGTVVFNIAANSITVNVPKKGWEHTITIHGSCIQNHEETQTLDLHVVVPAHQPFTGTFNAFKDACKRELGSQVAFAHYTLDKGQIAECAKHPVHTL